MRTQLFVCAMALMLAGCTTTTSRDEAFSGGAGQSYVLIAHDGTRPDAVETHEFKFQQVDMASSTFLRKYVYVRFGHKLISGGGDEFRKPESMAAARVRFAGKKIPPGDYALVSQDVYTSLGTSAINNVNCFSRGAVIYRFREGAINIIPLERSRDLATIMAGTAAAAEVPDPAALQAQVSEVLAGYPQMTGPTVMARQLGTATFESGKKRCNATGGFSFRRFPGVSVDW